MHGTVKSEAELPSTECVASDAGFMRHTSVAIATHNNYVIPSSDVQPAGVQG